MVENSKEKWAKKMNTECPATETQKADNMVHSENIYLVLTIRQTLSYILYTLYTILYIQVYIFTWTKEPCSQGAYIIFWGQWRDDRQTLNNELIANMLEKVSSLEKTK